MTQEEHNKAVLKHMMRDNIFNCILAVTAIVTAISLTIHLNKSNP